jgi:hypothetical protein
MSTNRNFQFTLLFESWIGNFPKTLLLVSRAKIQYARDSKRPDLWMLLFTNIVMSYIVILMSFQTIILLTMVGVNTPGPCWTKTLKSLESPPPFSISRTFRPPSLLLENISVPPLTSLSPPRHNKCTFANIKPLFCKYIYHTL